MKYEDARILIVDDNQINLFVLSKMLQKYGIEADCVPSGKACVKKCTKKKYDLIFLDHMMPEMDGIETLALLKEDATFKTPVIALTANTEEGIENVYIQSGFAEYMQKPVDNGALERILEKYLCNSDVSVIEQDANCNASNDTTIECDSEKATTGDNGNTISDLSLEEKEKRQKLLNNGFDFIDELLNAGMKISEYESLIQIFNEESKVKIIECDNFAKALDLKNYAIYVHGLKNDAAMINELKLSDFSKEHEINSKAGNAEYVKDNWDSLKGDWQSIIGRIEQYFA